jgi:hypothetical protein
MLRRLVMLAVLLAAVAAAGAWNYQRNLAREEQEKGPYASYSDAQLAALKQAYEGEIAALQKRYQARKAEPYRAGSGPLIGDQVREFERASARGRAIRDAGGDLAEREATLADIDLELSRRGGDPTQIFLNRLLSLDGL